MERCGRAQISAAGEVGAHPGIRHVTARNARNTVKGEARYQVGCVGGRIQQWRVDAGDGAGSPIVRRRDRHAAHSRAEYKFVHERRAEVVRDRERRYIARAIHSGDCCQRPIPRSGRRAIGELLIVVIVDPAPAEPRVVIDLVVDAQDRLPRVDRSSGSAKCSYRRRPRQSCSARAES